jgi:hypothetical protein
MDGATKGKHSPEVTEQVLKEAQLHKGQWLYVIDPTLNLMEMSHSIK